MQKRKSCTVNIVRLRKICRRFKEQNTILTSSLKVMKSRRRNVSENTISLDNSIWGICRFKTYGFPSFFISEENSNGKIKRFVRIAQPSDQLIQGDWGCASNERIVVFLQKSTARDFAKMHPNTIKDGAALAGNPLTKLKKQFESP